VQGLAMKNFNFTVLKKNVTRRRLPLIAPTLIIATALILGNPSFAEALVFRLALADVPGRVEIVAGDIQAGIKVLEDQLKLIKSGSNGDILATLCAAYILSDMLDMADRPCNEAVDVDPTRIAYNNRGVYRSHRGDYMGAREDFDHAQPQQLEAYIDELKAKDVGLLANDNFRSVDEYLAKYDAEEFNAAFAGYGAEIEDLND
jgi:hypothetical protein